MTKIAITLLTTGLLAMTFSGHAMAQDNPGTINGQGNVPAGSTAPAARPTVDDAAAAKALRAFLANQNSMGTMTAAVDPANTRR